MQASGVRPRNSDDNGIYNMSQQLAYHVYHLTIFFFLCFEKRNGECPKGKGEKCRTLAFRLWTPGLKMNDERESIEKWSKLFTLNCQSQKLGTIKIEWKNK